MSAPTAAPASAKTSAEANSGRADIFPAPDHFAKIYGAGTSQVVWTRLIADLETPVSAYLKLGEQRAMSFLLESI